MVQTSPLYITSVTEAVPYLSSASAGVKVRTHDAPAPGVSRAHANVSLDYYLR